MQRLKKVSLSRHCTIKQEGFQGRLIYIFIVKTKLSEVVSNWLPISKEEVVVFLRQLTTMYQSGLPIVSSIGSIAQGQPKGKFKNILEKMFLNLATGATLSATMANYSNIFSCVDLGMVKAGEKGGAIGEILDRVAFHEEKDLHLMRRVKATMTYPVIVFAGAVLLIFLLMNYLFAGLLETVVQFGGSIPLPTMILLFIVRVMKNPFLMFLAVFVLFIIVVTVKNYFKTPQGVLNKEILSLKLPLTGKIVRKIISARFCRALGTLYHCGVPLIIALETACEAVGSVLLASELRDRIPKVEQGGKLSDEVFSAPLFPPLVIRMVRAGEITSKLDELLFKVAGYYEDDIEYALESFMTTVEPFMIGILGLVVGFIMVATLSPLYQIINNFSN